MDSELRHNIIFLVDKGCARSLLIDSLVDPSPEPFIGPKMAPILEKTAVTALDELIAEGVLAQGQMYGGTFIVVAEFMPRTAARLRGSDGC